MSISKYMAFILLGVLIFMPFSLAHAQISWNVDNTLNGISTLVRKAARLPSPQACETVKEAQQVVEDVILNPKEKYTSSSIRFPVAAINQVAQGLVQYCGPDGVIDFINKMPIPTNIRNADMVKEIRKADVYKRFLSNTAKLGYDKEAFQTLTIYKNMNINLIMDSNRENKSEKENRYDRALERVIAAFLKNGNLNGANKALGTAYAPDTVARVIDNEKNKALHTGAKWPPKKKMIRGKKVN